MTPGTGAARWARGGLLSLLTVIISVGGHAVAGGSVHLSMPLLLGGSALAAISVAAAESRHSFAQIFGVVLLAQPVLHLLASMGTHGSSSSGGGAGVMVSGHVLAALLVSALLADAERSVWTVAGLLAPVRLPGRPTPPAPAHVVRLVTDWAVELALPIRRVLSLPQRGPPRAVCAH